MLLEMQSAMNNMMNNSQLHSSQGLAIAKPLQASATEPMSEDPGPVPSCSPPSSPRSSQSDSSSDREPTVAMDTASSSASPSASDSGEEEVIGSVTRAHQETFMYNQEQSSLTAEAPNAMGSSNSGSAQNTTNHLIEEQQEAWNQQKNLVTVAAQNPSSGMGPQGMEDNAPNLCPFRLSGSAVSHCPTYIHGAFKAPATEGPTNRACSGPLWRGGNRMHLVRLKKELTRDYFKHTAS